MAYTKKTEKIKTEWLILDEGTYYLDENGKAVTGWKEINNDTYFFNAEGLKVTGKLLSMDMNIHSRNQENF